MCPSSADVNSTSTSNPATTRLPDRCSTPKKPSKNMLKKGLNRAENVPYRARTVHFRGGFEGVIFCPPSTITAT